MRNLRLFVQVIFVLFCMASVMAIFLWTRCSIEGRRVTAGNMSPTLNENDKVLFDMTSYRSGKPFSRGQIVLFFPPYIKIGPKEIPTDPMGFLDKAFAPPTLRQPESSIKRVIGIPGDTIEVKNGDLYVNDVKLSEPYVKEPMRYELRKLKDLGGELLSGGAIYPFPGRDEAIVVPPGHLFVLGDNRNNSQDSHLWGFLDSSRVLGKAILVFYPRMQIIQKH